jgi:hypothetical protein
VIFPEAANGPYTLLVLVGLEAMSYNPDGSIFDTVCVGLETAWVGNVGKSMAEERIQAAYQAQLEEIYPVFMQRIAHLPNYQSPYPDWRSAKEVARQSEVFREAVAEAKAIWKDLTAEYGIQAPPRPSG